MSEEPKFVENDVQGETTLDVISEADKFNQWMYNTIKPYCKGKVLEIGSGIGNISNFFLQDNFKIQLTDIRTGYCERLEDKFKGNPNLLGVECINLTDEEFDTKFADHLNKYETVFALNVVEHIANDKLALQNCKKLLVKGGKLIILVPSYQRLFNQFDTELGHYRRYTKKSLKSVFKKADVDVIDSKYFNFTGIFGWYFTGNILKRKTIPEGQMKLFNRLVPVFKVVDFVAFKSLGLSTIVIGEK